MALAIKVAPSSVCRAICASKRRSSPVENSPLRTNRRVTAKQKDCVSPHESELLTEKTARTKSNPSQHVGFNKVTSKITCQPICHGTSKLLSSKLFYFLLLQRTSEKNVLL